MKTLGLALAALLAIAPAAVAQTAPDPVLRSVIAEPHRAPANSVRDVWRHPYETLAFWGLKPGLTVLEISPGAGWWTEILAPYAQRTGGRYIAATPSAAGAALQANLADEKIYGKFAVVDFGRTSRGLGPNNSADLVITARNVHNWAAADGRTDQVFADIFAVLKPGGVLGVEDHRSDPNPMKPDASDGYVSEAYVIAAAQKAGFVLDGKSEVNANPKDTKDHPFGVWTLPPVRRSSPEGQPADPGFDRAKYDAIGESDRMTLRFRKPG